MIVRRLYLQNYRVYEGVCELELPEGLIGIYGPNGAGKSYLIESIPWALYGYSRTAIDEVRTASVNEECVVEVTFEHENHTYVVRRTLKGGGRTLKHDAVVHADGMQVATGARDVGRYMQTVIGMNEKGFLASVFAEQKQLAALSAQAPAERRKLVLDLLGITPIEAAVKAARRDAKDADATLKQLQVVALDLDALGTERDDAAAASLALAAESTIAEAALGAAQRAAEAARARYDAMAREIEEGRHVARQFEELESRVKRLSEDAAAVAAAQSELEAMGDTAAAVATARASLDLVRALHESRETLAAAEKLIAEFGDEVAALEPPDDGPAVAARAAASEAKADVAALRATAKALAAALRIAEENLIRTDALEGDAECPTCGQPLGEHFADVRTHRVAEVDKARAAFDQANQAERKAAAKADELAAVAERAERELDQARKHWAQQTAARERQAEAQAALRNAATAVEKAEAAAAVAEGVLDVALADQQRAVADAEAADRRAAALRGEVKNGARVEADLAEVTKQRDEIGAELEHRRARAKQSGITPAGLKQAEDERTMAIDAAQTASERHTAAVANAARAVERANQIAIQYDRAKEQHDRIEPTKVEARLLGRLGELLGAFKDFEAASVGPRLAGHAKALFDDMTESTYADLELSDNFEVRITDQNQKFDLKRFSGSEVDLANLALRIAISECVSLQSGGAVGLLVLDEVFGPLDASRRQRLLHALTQLQSRFRQVLVVTHNDDIKAQLPSAIEVRVVGERRAAAAVV